MFGKALILLKWLKMLNGTSVLHMRQVEGLYYDKNEIKGYYSDLRHKVTSSVLLDSEGVPINITNRSEKIYFPISIFQYGLGAYDLYLETGNDEYKNKFYKVVDWALDNQSKDGSWDAFGWSKQNARFSSMAQSEGASLLCRAYKDAGLVSYFKAAKSAIDFMLLPVQEGGTTYYSNFDMLTFEETLEERTILNGMIFSIWGLYDLYILTKDTKAKKYYEDKLNMAINSLCHILPKYDCGYWSQYDLDGHITSPFYHDLHIEQLKVMYELFRNTEFRDYIEKWEMYKHSNIKSKKAFIMKMYQKLTEINTEIALIK